MQAKSCRTRGLSSPHSAVRLHEASGEERRDVDASSRDLFAEPRAATSNPVQVMTIHRSKGLEFDHAFLPALDRMLNRDRDPLLRWLDLPREGEGSDLLMAPRTDALETPKARSSTAISKRLMAARSANEQIRLLYVAMTRAKRTLHSECVTDGERRRHRRAARRHIAPRAVARTRCGIREAGVPRLDFAESLRTPPSCLRRPRPGYADGSSVSGSNRRWNPQSIASICLSPIAPGAPGHRSSAGAGDIPAYRHGGARCSGATEYQASASRRCGAPG